MRLGRIPTAGGQAQAGDGAFHDARCALKVARASGYENYILLSVRLTKLNPLNKSGHQDTLQGYDEFIQYVSVKKDNYIHSTALSRSCKITLSHLEKENNLSNRKTFWRWNEKAESISKWLGDIAIFRLATSDIVCAIEGNFGAILKWHEDFEAKYPFFHLWPQKIAARKTNLQICNRLMMGATFAERKLR